MWIILAVYPTGYNVEVVTWESATLTGGGGKLHLQTLVGAERWRPIARGASSCISAMVIKATIVRLLDRM